MQGASMNGGAMHPAVGRLLGLWSQIVDLDKTSELLGWDQETKMPSGGATARGKQLATLAGIRHGLLLAPELRGAIDAVLADCEQGTVEHAHARQADRLAKKARCIPEEHVRRKAELCSRAHESWSQAREAGDFSIFRDDLSGLIEMARREGEWVGAGELEPYDALLDDYEPGARQADLLPIFEELRREVSAIVHSVAASGRVLDESPCQGDFAPEQQESLGREMAAAIGFDFQRGRMDLAVHPFCSGFDSGDVRITWRHMRRDFRSALFGVMHEAGHGLYEQGLPTRWRRTPLGEAISLGVHESQSRLWENLVGRSRSFWTWALPRVQEILPGLKGVELDALVPALNTCRPSLIRVEADEGTYDLHVAVRFELERKLFGGDLQVDDLPAAWDDLYETTLGVRPQNVSEGVLQDVHWSMGAFGYFPTYSLGNLIAAQLFEAAERDLEDLPGSLASGNFAVLLGWLRENVHAHGSLYTAAEVVEKATGKPLSTEAFLARRRSQAREFYGVTGG